MSIADQQMTDFDSRRFAPPVPGRGNALHHGLTATTALPEHFEERVSQLRMQLCDELGAAGATEDYYVARMAYHAAAVEFACQAEPASLRIGAATGEQLAALAGVSSVGLADLQAVSAVTCHATTLIARYRTAHERAYHRWVDKLREVKAWRSAPVDVPEMPARFRGEAGCLAHLVARLRSESWRCIRCGQRRGYWLPSRTRRECNRCGMQHGPRTGTVMQHSRLPFTTWFLAIHCVYVRHTAPKELAEVLKIARIATARSLVRRIRDANSSPSSDRLLAGLREIFAFPAK